MKKKICILIIILLSLSLGVVYADSPIKVILNGRQIEFDQPPIIIDGRTLVPMRAMFENFGATIEWKDDTQSVVAITDNIHITLIIGNTIANISERFSTMSIPAQYYWRDMDIVLDVPAQIINGRTLVPLRFISETLSCNVEWIENSNTVILTEKVTTDNEREVIPPIENPVDVLPETESTPIIKNEQLRCEISVNKSNVSISGNYTIVFSISANGSGGSGNYQYKFETVQNGKIISTIDYSETNNISNKIVGSGECFVKITIKDSVGNLTTMDYSLTD